MNLQKHTRFFNGISSIYNLFFHHQHHSYTAVINANLSLLNLPANCSVLDIGCGTGAFTSSFASQGFRVTGVDIAEKMVKHAVQRGLNCHYGNVKDGLEFPEKSFDLVTSAYVAHGLDRDKRKKLFEEAARLSKGTVLFHDYNNRRNMIINIVEWLEDGDYFNFIKDGLYEMNNVFGKVEVIPIKKYSNWYICTP